jgi:hypothetical protein
MRHARTSHADGWGAVTDKGHVAARRTATTRIGQRVELRLSETGPPIRISQPSAEPRRTLAPCLPVRPGPRFLRPIGPRAPRAVHPTTMWKDS